MKIDEFKGKYRFLSNMYCHDLIKFDGMEADCVEKLYQAKKATNDYSKAIVLCSNTPYQAKKRGRELICREDWVQIREQVMEELLTLKFKIPELKKMLLATNDDYLEEGNNWGDMFWGVYKGVGKNKLGHLLMDIREKLKEE